MQKRTGKVVTNKRDLEAKWQQRSKMIGMTRMSADVSQNNKSCVPEHDNLNKVNLIVLLYYFLMFLISQNASVLIFFYLILWI